MDWKVDGGGGGGAGVRAWLSRKTRKRPRGRRRRGKEPWEKVKEVARSPSYRGEEGKNII